MAANDNDHLLDHQYDGIQEYDNPMPRWWVYIFWATIIFAPIYYFAPGTMGNGAKKDAMYAAEIAAFQVAHPAPAPGSGVTGPQLMALVAKHEAIEEGKEVFTKNCVACHGPDGGGIIGPNLTDDAWIHGGTPIEIYTTVNEGVLAKGMPAWGKALKPEDVSAVAAYVITLHGTKPANPKAAQGTVLASTATAADSVAEVAAHAAAHAAGHKDADAASAAPAPALKP
jgi:cytochrome c oxidase cbb3-type subunit 3